MAVVMSYRLTKVTSISFSSFHVNLQEGFYLTIYCPFGIQYWLQPGQHAVGSCTQPVSAGAHVTVPGSD